MVLFLASHKDITANKVIKTNNTLTVPGFDSDDSEDEFVNRRRNGEDLLSAARLGPDAPANYNYGRRRSRAVLYQLSGHYKNTEKSSKKMHSNVSFFYRCLIAAAANRLVLRVIGVVFSLSHCWVPQLRIFSPCLSTRLRWPRNHGGFWPTMGCSKTAGMLLSYWLPFMWPLLCPTTPAFPTHRSTSPTAVLTSPQSTTRHILT